MRTPALILGILLLVAGGLISAGMFSFTDTKEVLKIGDASLKVSKESKPDRTLGYVLLGAGALVIAVGALAKKR
jgi:hypothetical protein